MLMYMEDGEQVRLVPHSLLFKHAREDSRANFDVTLSEFHASRLHSSFRPIHRQIDQKSQTLGL
jgi:hypothetical protein